MAGHYLSYCLLLCFRRPPAGTEAVQSQEAGESMRWQTAQAAGTVSHKCDGAQKASRPPDENMQLAMCWTASAGNAQCRLTGKGAGQGSSCCQRASLATASYTVSGEGLSLGLPC